ncbi:TetR/AcrR family transcriptional regulator [Pelagibacterium limicola]|uniref:TetR/AcrR family transcriptional regulator n=1 Tax=Pelagibacterium limicola TaxID=2791022 RepID=UPI0018AFAE57|nr:TetR/AcrR family transcriptional regulator [Pelagibacterium limicola]
MYIATMARHFSNAERETIRTQLLAAGLERFTRHGLRGLRIEDVCRDIGIAKGSFYSFFPHKEALFLAIADDRDQAHKAEILSTLERTTGTASERAVRFFDLMVEKLRSDPLIAIVSVPEDLAAIMRRMPPERVAHEAEKDEVFMLAFCENLRTQGLGTVPDARAITGILGLLVSLVLQKALMSEDMFEISVALLRELFVLKVTGQAS